MSKAIAAAAIGKSGGSRRRLACIAVVSRQLGCVQGLGDVLIDPSFSLDLRSVLITFS
jgi:hypothetical protein